MYFSKKHNCTVVITYDYYALTSAILLKLLNPQIKIFYHENQIVKSDSFSSFNLGYWVQKMGIKYLKYCVWVSQPDVKRRALFTQVTGLSDIKVVRNFALMSSVWDMGKFPLSENLKKEGYIIGVYTGTMGKENAIYIKKIVEFTKISFLKFAIFMTGVIVDEEISNTLNDKRNNEGIAKIIYLGFLPKKTIYELLNSADFSLEFHGPTFSAQMNAGSSVKAGEYIAFGLPIIYPSFWDYEPYYKEIGMSYSDEKELIINIEKMVKNENLRRNLSRKSRLLFQEKLNFENEFRQFKQTVDYYMK